MDMLQVGDLLTKFGTSATAAGFASKAIQILKTTKWFPLISEKTSKTTMIVFSAVVAFITAAGIGHVWDPVNHSLLLTNLTFSGIFGHFWGAGQQMLGQEIWYQKLFRTGGATPVVVAQPVGSEGQPAPALPVTIKGKVTGYQQGGGATLAQNSKAHLKR